MQIFSEEQAEAFSFDVLDATELIPEELVPLMPIGRMVLNRKSDNFFAETEQVAFCTAHIVPGLDFSNDPLLAGRIHSYVDTQISRLGGPNFHELPMDAQVVDVHNNQRDGMHRQAISRGRANYEPNSLGGGCPFQAGPAGFTSFVQHTDGDKVRAKPELFADHFTQATMYYESQSPTERAHIANALRFELTRVQTSAIRKRVVSMLLNILTELGEKVAKDLGMDELPATMPKALAHKVTPEVERSGALSLFAGPDKKGIGTRRIAVIVADGVNGAVAKNVHAALMAEGAIPRYIGPLLGAVTTSEGDSIQVEATFETMPSVMFDALVVPGGDAAVKRLATIGLASDFIKDQYRHCKTILAVGKAAALLEGVGIPAEVPSGADDPGIIMAADGRSDAAISRFIDAVALHRHFLRETDPPVV